MTIRAASSSRNGALLATPGTDIGLLWNDQPSPTGFCAQARMAALAGRRKFGRVHSLSRTPRTRNYNNTAFVGVDFGFEVQIDQLAAPDGLPIHKTAAIYGFQGPNDPGALPVNPIGEWNCFEITVQGQNYTCGAQRRRGHRVQFRGGQRCHAHPERGLPSTNAMPRFIGLQTHTGRVAFRKYPDQATRRRTVWKNCRRRYLLPSGPRTCT